MSSHKKTNKTIGFWHRHKILRNILLGIVIILAILISWLVLTSIRAARYQSEIEPFYDTNGIASQGTPGELLRQEPLSAQVVGGTSQRILYRSQRADGSASISSGMIFIPNNSPSTPRPVVAWAHGTIGMGDDCAPSRLSDPTANIAWVNTMLQNGWVVVATDYAGLGTAGTEQYLVGKTEAYDVLNSVRAARQITNFQASNQFAVWGHSQGGHSALFTAQQALAYAPDLKLVSTVASAPAAELIPLLNQQYGGSIDWVIGPEILISWPEVYKNLDINSITTPVGLRNYKQIANKCIGAAAIDGMVRNQFGQRIFSQNPVDVPSWNAVAQAQSAPLLSPSQPLMVVESLSDTVVLPNTTALYIQKACQANSNLTSLWINNVGHLQIPQVTSPDVISWLSDRFANKPTSPTCSQALPLAPAS